MPAEESGGGLDSSDHRPLGLGHWGLAIAHSTAIALDKASPAIETDLYDSTILRLKLTITHA